MGFSRNSIAAIIAVAGLPLLDGAARAQSSLPAPGEDTYKITQAEKSACGDDAIRLCSSAYPDEDKLLSCMKTNKTSLSPACSATLANGLKRRGM